MNHIATFLIAFLIAIVTIFIIVNEIKKRKNGGGCGCGCSGCALKDTCHKK